MTPALLIISAAAALYLIYKRRLLSQFVVNGVAGLLLCVAAVCVSPSLHLRFSLNLFTAGVSLFLGPAGVAGIFALMWIWDV